MKGVFNMNSKIILIVILSFIIPIGHSSQIIPNEISIRQDIKDSVELLFDNNNFDKLETIANQYRDNEERTFSGFWKIGLFYNAFKVYKY